MKALRPQYQTGSVIGGWKLEQVLGSGGNGTVWRASKKGEIDRAYKILHRVDEISYRRFAAELKAISLAQGISGIVPVIDKYLPINYRRDVPWYSMPIAEPLDASPAEKSPLEIVNEFIKLAETLAELHRLDIHHRDIKIANILRFEGRLCFGDFGLAKFPKRDDITPSKRDVGPKFTMAPEMRRTPREAEGGPVDVYSLMKALWVALTGQTLGFDGQYNPISSNGLKNYHRDLYTTKMDQLLHECTDNLPSRRPVATEIVRRLKEWAAILDDFSAQNTVEWAELQSKLFPEAMPERVVWRRTDDIIRILQILSHTNSLNHMFYPSGGGMSFSGVSIASESGLIVLHTGFDTALKPEKLSFESFGGHSEWNYFRLEASPIATSGTKGAYISEDGFSEEVCEILPGRYVSRDAWEYNEYKDKPLPDGARPLVRYLKGSFVIFSTTSAYNADPSTYDARHDKVSEDAFRKYIARHVK